MIYYELCDVCEERRIATNVQKGILFYTVCWFREGAHTMKIAQRIWERIHVDRTE